MEASTHEREPQVGQIVMFRQNTGDPEAAIITRVWSPQTVNLTVFTDMGTVLGVTSCAKRREGDLNMRTWDFV